MGASAYRGSAQSIGDSSTTICAYDTEKYDLGGNFNVANGVFTAPITGYYFVSHCVIMSGIADAKRILAYIYINGAVQANAGITTGAATNNTAFISGVFYVVAGQTIDGRVYQTGGTLNLGHTAGESQITIHLLSI